MKADQIKRHIRTHHTPHTTILVRSRHLTHIHTHASCLITHYTHINWYINKYSIYHIIQHLGGCLSTYTVAIGAILSALPLSLPFFPVHKKRARGRLSSCYVCTRPCLFGTMHQQKGTHVFINLYQIMREAIPMPTQACSL